MAGIGVGNAAAEKAAEGGAQELQEWTEQTRQDYLQKFYNHRIALNNCYVNFGSALSPVATVIDNLKKNEQIKQYFAETYPSIKGGADIYPIEQNAELMQKQYEEIMKKQEDINNINIKNSSQEIQKMNNIQQFKEISLKAMADVYSLKQQVTGISEHFAFMYEGAGGAISTVTVPVDMFFKEILKNTELLNNMFDFQQSEKVSSSGLRFNKKYIMDNSIFSQMAYQSNQVQKFDIEKIYGGTAMDFYNSMKEQRQNLWVTKSKLNKNEKEMLEKDENGILRVDNLYYVIRKNFETGFLAQSIFNAYINNSNFKYEKDQVPWYMGEDVNKIGTNIGYSVKSFLENAPSLMTMNSLDTALSKIIAVLTIQKDVSKIKETLKSYVFSAAQKMENAVENEINNLPLINGIF